MLGVACVGKRGEKSREEEWKMGREREREEERGNEPRFV